MEFFEDTEIVKLINERFPGYQTHLNHGDTINLA